VVLAEVEAELVQVKAVHAAEVVQRRQQRVGGGGAVEEVTGAELGIGWLAEAFAKRGNKKEKEQMLQAWVNEFVGDPTSEDGPWQRFKQYFNCK
jgi:hypothetical protein